MERAASADVKIFLFDATNPVLREDLIDENTILVANKIDLAQEDFVKTKCDVILSISKEQNTSELLKKLEEKITAIIPNQTSPLITQERYRNILENAVIKSDSYP